MSALVAGLTPQPMTAQEFDSLHPSTQRLIIAGWYDEVWPEARQAYIAAAAEYDLSVVLDMLARGIELIVH